MWVQALAAAVFLVFLWTLFRFAMSLRFAKLSREQERRAEQQRGRRLVAEAPDERGEIRLVFEDEDCFGWGEHEVAKAELVGARLLLNRRVVGEARRPDASLPRPGPEAEYEGQERWDVQLHLRGGGSAEIACGSLREGVSREAASAVFAALRRVLEEGAIR